MRSSLKSSIGPSEWLDFFKYASSCFAILEGTTRLHAELSDLEIVDITRSMEQKLGALNALRRFSASHSTLQGQIRPGYSHFVLRLDTLRNNLTIEAFGEISSASKRYADLEKETVDDSHIDVVMVAAESVESLARGYPNYFSDTEAFIDTLLQIIGDAWSGHSAHS